MGVEHFGIFEQKWPCAMQKLITCRIHFYDYRSALDRHKEDIKTVLEIGTAER